MSRTLPDDLERTGRLDWSLWRRVLRQTRPYRREIRLMAACGISLAGIDTLFPVLTGRMVDEALSAGPSGHLLSLGALYGGLVVVFSALIRTFIVLAGRIATGLAHDLRRDAFGHLQRLSFGYFDVRPVGWLVARLTSDTSKVASVIPWFLLDLAWGMTLLLAMVGAMLWLAPGLALQVLLVVPPLIAVTWFFKARLLESSRLVRQATSRLTGDYNEGIAGVRTTRTLSREQANLDDFKVQTGALYGHATTNAIQSSVYLPLVVLLGSVGVAIALWRGGVQVGTVGGLSLGTLIAFLQFATLFSMPIQELAHRFAELQAAQAAAERITGLLDTEPEIGDDAVVRRAIERTAARGRRPGEAADGLPDRIESIEFRSVDFAYEPASPVLTGFDLRIEAGQTIALVGPTGGGKSTIASLVARFYEPTAGRILIDGIDIRQRSLDWLQSNLGVVLQVPHLFSGTIAENIRYGRLDADLDQIVRAAALAGADEFIAALESGYETEVGEGGARLSTGQRQLVTLSRAILADPKIVILDEATSSVDTETEFRIQRGIEATLEDRIAIVIAHRLSTIRSADRILVIDGGRIVEEGDHESLLAAGGAYRALHDRQFADERTRRVLAG